MASGETAAKAMAAAEPCRGAYVTLLAGEDDGESLQAVVRLAESLRKVGSAYPLVVAVLPGVPESHRDVLVSQGCIVRDVEPVYPPPPWNKAQLAVPPAPHNVVNCSKLRVWEFVEYERVVYLDAGVHVLKNIDGLFDLDNGHFYATDLAPPPAPNFSAGIFVHEPSLVTAEALLDALRVTSPSSSFLEQEFLNSFFRDQYKPIPLEHRLVMGHPKEQHDEPKNSWTKELPTVGCRLVTNATAFVRQNLPCMATLAASSAAVGVVTNAANPAICFSFYAVFIAAIAAVAVSLRGM